MDHIFIDRLNAKIQHNLSLRGHPDALYGLRPYVASHLDHNGKLLEDALELIKRFWDRARPFWVKAEARMHEQILIRMLDEDRKSLEVISAEFIKRYPQSKDQFPKNEVDHHYNVYQTKVRDEIAFLQAVRRREISEEFLKWTLGAAIPVICVFLSAWLASDARSTLKEINGVRQETAELARASLITSSIILDRADRPVAPVHKVAAAKRIKDIESRLAPHFPAIHTEVKDAIRQINADAEKFWKRYEALPESKREKFLDDYEKQAQ